MRSRRVVHVVGMVVLTLTSLTGPALADPPPSNKNINPFTFDCTRGSESRQFVGVAIGQSASIAGQVVGTTEVVMFVQIIVQGVVVFDIPGLSTRSELWTCTVEEVPDLVAKVMITPRARQVGS
jgi:hypothetical protein